MTLPRVLRTTTYHFHEPTKELYTPASCWSTERPKIEHLDPMPCVACRSEWQVGSQPPHPAELASKQLMAELRGDWATVP